MKIVIGCDPNAESLKQELIDELQNLGHEVDDFGSDDPIYANVVIRVGEAVVGGHYKRGIVLCGTGIGASIAANKVPGVYCALLTDTYQVRRAYSKNILNKQEEISSCLRLFHKRKENIVQNTPGFPVFKLQACINSNFNWKGLSTAI